MCLWPGDEDRVRSAGDRARHTLKRISMTSPSATS
jgi:hypothetical protein